MEHVQGDNFLISLVRGGDASDQSGDEGTVAVSGPTASFPNGFPLVIYGNTANNVAPSRFGLHFSVPDDATLGSFSSHPANAGSRKWPPPPGMAECRFGNDNCVSAVVARPGRFVVTSFGTGELAIAATDDFGKTWQTRQVGENGDHPWHAVDEATGDVYVMYFMKASKDVRLRRITPAPKLDRHWAHSHIMTVNRPTRNGVSRALESAFGMHVTQPSLTRGGPKMLHLVAATTRAESKPCTPGSASGRSFDDVEWWHATVDLPLPDQGDPQFTHTLITTGSFRKCVLATAALNGTGTFSDKSYFVQNKPMYAIDGPRQFVVFPRNRDDVPDCVAIHVYWRDANSDAGWQGHVVAPSTRQQYRPSVAVDATNHRVCISWASVDEASGDTVQCAIIQDYDLTKPMEWDQEPFDVSIDEQRNRQSFVFSDPDCHTWDYNTQAALSNGAGFLVTWADARQTVMPVRSASRGRPLKAGCSRIWGAIVR